MSVEFSEENIQKLFGHEAAENEDPHRLMEYYFKAPVYEKVVADVPLRVLVGHKGIGKSALFQVAMADDKDHGRLAVFIRPDDIAEISTDETDFLLAIRSWKVGLVEIIARKVLAGFGVNDKEILGKISRYVDGFIDALASSIKNLG